MGYYFKIQIIPMIAVKSSVGVCGDDGFRPGYSYNPSKMSTWDITLRVRY